MRDQQTVPMTEKARLIQEAVAAGRAAERNRRNAQRADHAIGYAISLFGLLVAGWLFMLAVGIARANWLPALPTIDYSTALGLASLAWCAWLSVSLYDRFRQTGR